MGKPRAITDANVKATVARVSKRLLDQGAKATLLTGSHARGQASASSDIDLFAVGDGPSEHVDLVDGQTVSVHWFRPEDARQRLESPESAVVSVAGWADALLVDDPVGVGAELQREAREWSWERIGAEADAHVIERVVGASEWARKLGGAIAADRRMDVAALTADLALRLGRLIAVHRRVNAQSENGLWDAIAEAAPAEWASDLRAALRAGDEPLDEAARAALRLFRAVADDVAELLDDRERAIVDHALELLTRQPGSSR